MSVPTDRLSGTFWLLFLYDVCEEIRLEELRAILGAQPAGREPSFRRPTPGYVRFEKPPVVEYLEPLLLKSGKMPLLKRINTALAVSLCQEKIPAVLSGEAILRRWWNRAPSTRERSGGEWCEWVSFPEWR